MLSNSSLTLRSARRARLEARTMLTQAILSVAADGTCRQTALARLFPGVSQRMRLRDLDGPVEGHSEPCSLLQMLRFSRGFEVPAARATCGIAACPRVNSLAN
jgi:hypothetical protein